MVLTKLLSCAGPRLSWLPSYCCYRAKNLLFLKPPWVRLHEKLFSFSTLLTTLERACGQRWHLPVCQQKATLIYLALLYLRTNSGFRMFCCSLISFLIAKHTYMKPDLSVWSVYPLSWSPNCLLVLLIDCCGIVIRKPQTEDNDFRWAVHWKAWAILGIHVSHCFNKQDLGQGSLE